LYTSKGATENVAISGGFVEVSANKVAVLADSAQTAEDVDIGEARAEREAAERELSAAGLTSVEKAETLRERVETAAAKLAVAGTK
jgi:F-type H+-transporting ATPase subunit epsilon